MNKVARTRNHLVNETSEPEKRSNFEMLKKSVGVWTKPKENTKTKEETSKLLPKTHFPEESNVIDEYKSRLEPHKENSIRWAVKEFLLYIDGVPNEYFASLYGTETQSKRSIMV